MASDKLAKLERLLKALGRNAQRVEDFELGDQMGRTVNCALELLSDIQAEANPGATDDLAIAA